MTMLCFGMLWSPTLGVQHVAAATEEAQQQGSITGTVVDSQGEPVIGASVIIVGGAATQGTVKLHLESEARYKVDYLLCGNEIPDCYSR